MKVTTLNTDFENVNVAEAPAPSPKRALREQVCEARSGGYETIDLFKLNS